MALGRYSDRSRLKSPISGPVLNKPELRPLKRVVGMPLPPIELVFLMPELPLAVKQGVTKDRVEEARHVAVPGDQVLPHGL
jgi:hypothetical protein